MASGGRSTPSEAETTASKIEPFSDERVRHLQLCVIFLGLVPKYLLTMFEQYVVLCEDFKKHLSKKDDDKVVWNEKQKDWLVARMKKKVNFVDKKATSSPVAEWEVSALGAALLAVSIPEDIAENVKKVRESRNITCHVKGASHDLETCVKAVESLIQLVKPSFPDQPWDEYLEELRCATDTEKFRKRFTNVEGVTELQKILERMKEGVQKCGEEEEELRKELEEWRSDLNDRLQRLQEVMQREHKDIKEVVRKGFDVTLQKVDKLENRLKDLPSQLCQPKETLQGLQQVTQCEHAAIQHQQEHQLVISLFETGDASLARKELPRIFPHELMVVMPTSYEAAAYAFALQHQPTLERLSLACPIRQTTGSVNLQPLLDALFHHPTIRKLYSECGNPKMLHEDYRAALCQFLRGKHRLAEVKLNDLPVEVAVAALSTESSTMEELKWDCDIDDDDATGNLLDCLRSTSLKRITIRGRVGKVLLPILRALAANTKTVDRTMKCWDVFPLDPPLVSQLAELRQFLVPCVKCVLSVPLPVGVWGTLLSGVGDASQLEQLRVGMHGKREGAGSEWDHIDQSTLEEVERSWAHSWCGEVEVNISGCSYDEELSRWRKFSDIIQGSTLDATIELLCAVVRGIIPREDQFVLKLQMNDEQVSRLVELEDIAKNKCAVRRTEREVEAEYLRTHDFMKYTLTVLELKPLSSDQKGKSSSSQPPAKRSGQSQSRRSSQPPAKRSRQSLRLSQRSKSSDQKGKSSSSQPPASQSKQRKSSRSSSSQPPAKRSRQSLRLSQRNKYSDQKGKSCSSQPPASQSRQSLRLSQRNKSSDQKGKFSSSQPRASQSKQSQSSRSSFSQPPAKRSRQSQSSRSSSSQPPAKRSQPSVTDAAATQERCSLLNELLCKKHLTKEEHSKIVEEGKKWGVCLAEILLAKPVKVVLESSEVLERHGFSAKDMKMLRILEDNYERFKADMDARAIAKTLMKKGVISKSLEKTIDDARSKEEKNIYLYEDVFKYGTQDTLMTVCEVAVAVTGASQMVALGQFLMKELKRGVEVLESCEEDFFKHMDAQILEAPQSKKVIPEHIKRKIMEADTRQEANSILFDYLMSNSTKSSLSALCEVLKTTEGKEMAALGKDMLLKLKQVHKQEVEEVSQWWEMASPKVVAVVEQYKRDQPELTGRQIRIKLVEDKVCCESELPTLSAIYGILRRLLAKDSLDDCRKTKRRFLLDHPDVTCFYTFKKIIEGKETDQRCLVIGVSKKKKESELEEQWVLPKEIQHGWYRHFVDVVEEELQLLGPKQMQSVNNAPHARAVPGPGHRVKCKGYGTGTVGFWAKKRERVGLVTNKHLAWHQGCKLVNANRVHIATVEDIAGTNVDAAFALCQENQEVPMIPVRGNWCKPYVGMPACFYTWKLGEHNGSNDTPHDINVCIKAIDGTAKIPIKTVKTLNTLSMDVSAMNWSNVPLQLSDIKEFMSKYYGMKTGFKVRCKFSYKLPHNETKQLEGELEGSAQFLNSTDAKQMDDEHVKDVTVQVKGCMEGHGIIKGTQPAKRREEKLRVSISFEGTAVKEVITYEDQINFIKEDPGNGYVGVPGQSGSLLRTRDRDGTKAVGLVFAGKPRLYAWANPIEDVLKALGNIRKFSY